MRELLSMIGRVLGIENKGELKIILSLIGSIWFVYILSVINSYVSILSITESIHLHFSQTINYELDLKPTYIIYTISFFLMLSSIIQFNYNEKIKKYYYRIALIGIFISLLSIKNFYYANSVFLISKQFYNPAINPFIISITTLLLPLLKIKKFQLNKQ